MLWQSTDEQIKSISNFLAKNANQQSKFNASHFFQEKKKKGQCKTNSHHLSFSYLHILHTQKSENEILSDFQQPWERKISCIKKTVFGLCFTAFYLIPGMI